MFSFFYLTKLIEFVIFDKKKLVTIFLKEQIIYKIIKFNTF